MKSKIYPCPYAACGKIYSSTVNLKRHVDCIHLKVKDFTCPVCSKSLSSKQNYREHLYIHSGTRPFCCGRCGVCFRQGSQLSQHKKTHKIQSFTEKCSELRLTDLMTFSFDRFFNPLTQRIVSTVPTCSQCPSLPSLLLIPEKLEPCAPIESNKVLF